jgi:sugar/nucleoside kinase (ribokinase family)
VPPANFAFHAQQLGQPAAIVSRVGDDALGRDARAELVQLGMRQDYIQNDPPPPDRHSHRPPRWQR